MKPEGMLLWKWQGCKTFGDEGRLLIQADSRTKFNGGIRHLGHFPQRLSRGTTTFEDSGRRSLLESRTRYYWGVRGNIDEESRGADVIPEGL